MRLLFLSLTIFIEVGLLMPNAPSPLATMTLEIKTMADPSTETIILGSSLSPLKTLGTYLVSLSPSSDQYPALAQLLNHFKQQDPVIAKELVIQALTQAEELLASNYDHIIEDEQLKTMAYLLTECKNSISSTPQDTSPHIKSESVQSRSPNSILLKAPGGTGTVTITPGASALTIDQSLSTTDTPRFRGIILEDTSVTPKTITMQAPTTLTNSYTLTWPLDVPAASGYALTSTTGGTLSWSPFASGSYWVIGGNNITSGTAILGTDASSTQNIAVQTNGTTRMTIANSTGIITAATALYADGGIDVTATGGSDSLNIGNTNADIINVGVRSSSQDINIGTGSGGGAVNIATGSGVSTINIGAGSDTVNIGGTLTWVKTTDLQVTDKLITVNQDGTAASGDDAGMQVYENPSANAGYVKTGDSRTSWLLKAPATAGIVHITPAATDYTINQGVSTSDTPSFMGVKLKDATTGTITLQAPASVTSYSNVWPAAVAAANNSALVSDTSGNLSWYAVSPAGDYFINGGNTVTATATLGTDSSSNYGLNIQTYGVTQLAISNSGDVSITDKLITLNKGGATSSGSGAGIEIEENSVITGYAKSSSDRKSWQFVAPAQAYITTLSAINANITLSAPATGSYFAGSGTVNSTATGTNNLGLGASACSALTSGTDNTCLGYNAGSTYTTGSNNICIGSGVTGAAIGESNTIRLGNTSNTVTYITGISTISLGASANLVGITTGHQLGTTATTLNANGSLNVTGNITATNSSAAEDLRLTGNAGTASDWSILSGSGGTDNLSILEQGVGAQFTINAGGKTAIGQGVSPDSTYRLKVADSSGGYGSIIIGDVATGNAVLRTLSSTPDYLNIGFTGTGSQLDTLRVTRTGDMGIGISTIIYRDTATPTPYIHHTGPTSPVSNIFVGDNAGNVSVSGADNTGIGVGALYTVGSGQKNVACGRSALEKVTSGNYNVAVGRGALYNQLTGANNVAVGDAALYTATASSANVAVGAGTLLNATTSNQTAVGYLALYNATSGTNNTAIGYGTLQQLTTTSNNTALGYNTLTNCSGSENTAIGSGALDAIGNSSYNTALGYNALTAYSPAAGAGETTSLGHRTGEALTTGVQNVFVGGAAGLALTTGSNNTFIGYLAGSSLTTSDSNNICIGSNVSGTAGDNQTIRIGSSQTSCYIAGINGVSVDTGSNIGKLVETYNGKMGTTSSSHVVSVDGIIQVENQGFTFTAVPYAAFTTSGKSLAISFGRVTSSGSIVSDSGNLGSISKTGTGVYEVYYGFTYAYAPSAHVTIDSSAGTRFVNCVTGTTYSTVYIANSSSTATDDAFSFFAIGFRY